MHQRQATRACEETILVVFRTPYMLLLYSRVSQHASHTHPTRIPYAPFTNARLVP